MSRRWSTWSGLTEFAQPGYANATWDETTAALQQGLAAQSITWGDTAGAMEAADQSAVEGKMGYASIPSLDGAKPGAADLGAWNFGINSSGKNKEAAYLFTAWALSQGTQKLIGEGGGLPSLTSTFQDPALVAKFPYWTQAMTSLEELRTRPRIPEAPAITDALALALYQVLSGGQNAKAGLDGAQQQVQTIMNGHLPVTDQSATMDPDEPSTSPTLTARGGVSGTQAVGTVPEHRQPCAAGAGL